MDNLTTYVNEQGDPFYIKGRNLGFLLGIEKGIQEGLREGLQKGLQEGLQNSQTTLVKNLLTNTDFDDERIAGLVGVSVTFVQEVRQTMSDQ